MYVLILARVFARTNLNMTAAKSRKKWSDEVEISAVKDMSMYLYTIRVDKLEK